LEDCVDLGLRKLFFHPELAQVVEEAGGGQLRLGRESG
jgi:hypothetical protein